MTDAIIFNLLMFLCGIGIAGWIATYKPAGENAQFSRWFAYHLWWKSKGEE